MDGHIYQALPPHFAWGSKVTRRKFVHGEGEPADEAKVTMP